MFGSRWREKLPGVQTEWGEIRTTRSAVRYTLSVPGADFTLSLEVTNLLLGAESRLRVTYDLRAGRIETIEVGNRELANSKA
jgi:hypothetical protein